MPDITDREYSELRRKADQAGDERQIAKYVAAILVAVILAIMVFIFAWKLVTPKLNLYRSNTEKQAVIKEQEAISEAEVFAAEKRVIAAKAEADARRIEAEGIADAQKLIASTLTPEYLQWRYYEVLAVTDSQVIYVPTESALPITEAGRLDVEPRPSTP